MAAPRARTHALTSRALWVAQQAAQKAFVLSGLRRIDAILHEDELHILWDVEAQASFNVSWGAGRDCTIDSLVTCIWKCVVEPLEHAAVPQPVTVAAVDAERAPRADGPPHHRKLDWLTCKQAPQHNLQSAAVSGGHCSICLLSGERGDVGLRSPGQRVAGKPAVKCGAVDQQYDVPRHANQRRAR